MKWTKEKLDLFFAMKDEGCSTDEICEALGCEPKTIYNKVDNLKKMNGGKLPKYKYNKVKTEHTEVASEPLEARSHDSQPTKTPTEYICGTEEDREIVVEAETCRKPLPSELPPPNEHPSTERAVRTEPEKRIPHILTLASMMIEHAERLGLGEPTHFYCDISSVREESHISGLDGTGKVYELTLSITDPQKAVL